ncbi:MAG TPA: hypothetical protein VNZ22_14685, partial [Bacillota bacterium]|nr:hypothetical protein [Bacillota bacterium]
MNWQRLTQLFLLSAGLLVFTPALEAATNPAPAPPRIGARPNAPAVAPNTAAKTNAAAKAPATTAKGGSSLSDTLSRLTLRTPAAPAMPGAWPWGPARKT